MTMSTHTAATGGLFAATGGVIVLALSLGTTGGMFTQNSGDWQPPVVDHTPRYRAETMIAAREEIRTPAENLIYVRDLLGISATDIADVCDVSRQSVHKWIRQKAAPTESNARPLRDLSVIAQSFQNNGLRNGRHLLTIRVEGDTLLDAVHDGRDYDTLLKTIIESAKAAQDRYDQSGLAERPQRTPEAWNPSFYPALSPLQSDV